MRARPSTTYTMPVASARAAANLAASSVPSSATPTRGVMMAATTAATAALGPWAICFDVPNRAYPNNAAKAVYSPYWTGTPAIDEYARDCGTRSAQMETLAIASRASHDRS